ncbi:2-oxoacid decarboxylase/dehydrogenase/transferase, putative [Syntrophotalea carbinolica DSM 2380]|uniref:2-oxoacid decarboxylase/dehydrogenase/transferase, putative n=1 Tax=Syntrophotalea carbinolica (strain DSM 2380 / NBRC 103641 / GraBd1) TaxID=338963 RepID=Q3A0L4_SYNC1|nr:thiamine pyrophosphate-dependent enzyme [Syntrophotalea carbinolica]ABA90093.1 2-oxoacid decarboxylase/dehydrogenase/transferase, putative [Syntrophotalea carbinolica DSM 2380]
MKQPTTVSEYLIRRLADYGVEHVFGVPGDYVLQFYQQLENSPLKVVNTCDEQGAGFAADAYARLRGLGVVCVTYCVGGLKIANTTAQAFAEKSPLVVISGAPGLNERHQNPLLHHKVRDFDTQLNIFRHLTVAATDLIDVENACCEIDRVLAAAVRHKRPVYIELPRDLTGTVCSCTRNPLPPATGSDPDALREALAETVQRLGQARHPVLVAGIEIQRFGLQKPFMQLVEATGIPFATTPLSKSTLSEDHPLFVGVYEGAVGKEQVRQVVEQSDCLVMLGAFMTDVNLGIFTADLDQALTVSSSSDGSSIAFHQYSKVFLVDFLSGLLAQDLPQRALTADQPSPASSVFEAQAKPITIARLFEYLEIFIDRHIVLLADPGEAMFAAADLTIRHPAAFLSPAYYTSMGFAVPGAIGAQLARPDLRPLVLVGDGAFQMTGMEISTAARFGLSPIVVVLNNNGYGTERPMTDGGFNDIPAWDYHRLPEVVGAGQGFEVYTEQDFDQALKAAMERTDAPSIIDVHLDPDDHSPALKRLTDALGAKVRGEK